MAKQIPLPWAKNPFIGTHSRRLLGETAKAVDVHIKNATTKRARKEKSLFDIAFGYKNLG